MTLMKKTGRRQALNPEEKGELLLLNSVYQMVRRECSPEALARRYHLSPSTVREYTAQSHKRAPGEAATGGFCPLVPNAIERLLRHLEVEDQTEAA